MSGGVGPTGKDIRLPGDDASERLPSHAPHHRFASVRQLNALAVATVLAASGMVAIEDIGFALFTLPYIYFLSKFAFPNLHPSSSSPDSPVFGDRNLLLTVYISVGALIGLFVPIAYILEGIVEGDKEGIKAAVPHVFLLACQIFMEGVTFSHHYSLPMRALVPILYNARRIFTLADWLKIEIGKTEADDHGSSMRLLVGWHWPPPISSFGRLTCLGFCCRFIPEGV